MEKIEIKITQLFKDSSLLLLCNINFYACFLLSGRKKKNAHNCYLQQPS